MPVTDVGQITSNLNVLQLREAITLPTHSVYITSDKFLRSNPMEAATTVLSRQGNQNAAALSPEEGIGSLRDCGKYPVVQENGQRRYGPPRNWRSDPPPRGCEVFIGKIPRDCFEDELIPVFEQIGPIYMFRLMMEFNGANRGYGFCVYTNREDTKRAVQKLDNFEIRKGKTIGVCFSVDNCRLFVGGIPKNKTREEIMAEMKRVTDGVKDVISYPSITDKSKNRGFAFVEYESHKAAAMARRKLMPGRIQLWNQQIAVDWAEPEREVNEDIMSKVKILYVRNLMLSTTEETLREHFVRAAGGDPNCVERVKKISDYAFIHFKEREVAANCLNRLNETMIEGSKIEVTWAKPVDKNEASSRQSSGHSSAKLMSDLAFVKDPRASNPLLIDPRANATFAAASGLLPHLDSAIPFLLSPMGQPTVTSDLLSLNPSVSGNPATLIALSNSSNSRLGMSRVGRRNAAGSRGAGMLREKKHPVEILEEQCRLAGWGTPSFTVLPAEFVDTISGAKIQLYVGQVFLPNLRLQFQAQRYYATPDEARLGACEVAISNLQFNQMMSLDNLGTSVSRGASTHSTTFLTSETSTNNTANQQRSGTSQEVQELEDALQSVTVRSQVVPGSNTNGTTINCPQNDNKMMNNSSALLESSALPNSTQQSGANVSDGLSQTSYKTAVGLINNNCIPTQPTIAQHLVYGGSHIAQQFTAPGHSSNTPFYKQYPEPQFVAFAANNHITSCPLIDPFNTNYALSLGSNIGSTGTATFLPLQLTANGQNANNTLGFLQAQTLPSQPGQLGVQTSMALSPPSEVSTALGLNGFEYTAPFLPNAFTNANLLASFTSQPTYLVDPSNGSSTMVVGSGGNLNGLSSIFNLQQANGNGTTEMLSNVTTSQAVASLAACQQGLYTIGLQSVPQESKMNQMGNNSNHLVNLLPSNYQPSVPNANAPNQGSQNSLNCLSVPTPVQLA